MTTGNSQNSISTNSNTASLRAAPPVNVSHVPHKHFSKILFFSEVLLILLIFFIILFFVYFKIQTGNKPEFSKTLSNTNFCPQLLMFPAVIEKIEGNAIYLVQSDEVLGQKQPKSQKSSRSTLKGITTDNSSFSQSANFIPYIFKKTPYTTTQQITVKELRAGMPVTLSTLTDLCQLTKPEVEIYKLNVNLRNNSVVGVITEIKEDSFILQSTYNKLIYYTAVNSDKPIYYSVLVTPETEISYADTSSKSSMVTPYLLSFSDLQKDMQVKVYTDVDVSTTQKLKALLIQPLSFANIQPAASPSSQLEYTATKSSEITPSVK